jgi:hypothetical protein
MRTSLEMKWEQGDQIGRIFAHWAVVYFVDFLYTEVDLISVPLFPTLNVMR